MDSPNSSDLSLLARQLDLPVESVETVSNLLDSGHTHHFIARYRRDEVGGLSAQQIGKIKRRLDRRRQLEARKEVILKAIATRGRLSDELEKQIRETHSPKILEDRYLPFKSKKNSSVDEAMETNLAPLADAIMSADDSRSIQEIASAFVDPSKGIETVQHAIDGARGLIEERFNYNIELRKALRRVMRRNGVLTTTRSEDPITSDADAPSNSTPPNPAPPNATSPNATSPSSTSDVAHEAANADSSGEQPKSTEASPGDAAPESAAPKTAAPESAAPDAPQGDDVTSVGHVGDEVRPDQTADPRAAETPSEGSAKTVGPASSNGATEVKSTKRTSRVTSSGVTLSKEARRQLRREARHRKRKRLESSFHEFFDFHESVGKVREHRILAIDRGERFRVLDVKIAVDKESIFKESQQILVPTEHPRADYLTECLKSSLDRQVIPSLERDIRRELTDRAERHAVQAFSENLKKLLLRRPFPARVFAISSNHRTGCHIAVLDRDGKVLEHKQLHLLANDERTQASHAEALDTIRRHRVSVIAIGSGKGSREIEQLAGAWIQTELSGLGVRYNVVNASGANRYATSVLASEELPDLTPGTREAAVIGRRFLDPLAEFVKIEPGAIDVGTYPEEMKAKPIQDTLQSVVFDCVNETGVDLNAAHKSLLRNVSGLNHLTAQRICEHREKNGPFRSRTELANVAGLSDEARSQAVGFLKIFDGDHPLDATNIHPDHYPIAEKILEKGGSSIADLGAYLAAVRAARDSQSTTFDATQTDAATAANRPGQPEPPGADNEAPSTTPLSEDETKRAEASQPTDPVPLETESNGIANTPTMPASEKQAGEKQAADKQAGEQPASPRENTQWDFADKAKKFDAEILAQDLGVGQHLTAVILSELARPLYDKREEHNGPTLRTGTISFESLKPGMAIDGTVSNVVDFGVFVDIGLKEAGLVHISRIADHFIRDPNEFYSAGQSLRVWVVDVDAKKRRVALTAIEPGTEKEKSPSSQSRRQRPKTRGGQPQTAKGSRRHKTRTFKPKTRRPPTPAKPITEGMIEGKEPMRTFSDLLQFADTKRKTDKGKSSKDS